MRDRDGPEFRRVFVDTPDGLDEPAGHLQSPETIGLDVEMGQRIKRLPGGLTKGEQILALIQLAGGGLSVAVDPLRIHDLSPLSDLMSSAAVKVVLGGATDIQLLEERGLPVRNVADLAEMAVAVFGHKEEGMRALADRALGVQIDKSIRRENWLRRPIHPSMLNYAHRDAELTLRIYHWFRRHHPDVVASHTRTHLRPALPAEMPEWIRKYLTRRLDATRLLKEEGIDAEAESSRLAKEIGATRRLDLSPGQQRRLIRLIGDLRLAELYEDIRLVAQSPSSIFRSSAARALGRLGDERGRPILEGLLQDEIADVQAAARHGLHDLDAGPEKPYEGTVDQEDVGAMKPEALAALRALRHKLVDEDSPEPASESSQ